MPPQLSGAHVEGDNRIGVEIVALSKVDGQVGRRVRDRDVQIAVLDIETETGPDGAAANRNLLRVLPCLVTGFTRPGHGVESPDRGTVGQTERAHPSLKIVLAAGGPYQHEILEHERRHRERFSLRRLRHLPRPQQATGIGGQGQQVAVRRRANDSAILDCDATIPLPHLVVSRLPLVAPFDTTRCRIERNRARHRRHIHRAVVDDRSRLEVVALADLKYTRRRQARGRRRVDVVERRKPRAAVIVTVDEPVGRA